jgi:S1-C subfamily serine protease
VGVPEVPHKVLDARLGIRETTRMKGILTLLLTAISVQTNPQTVYKNTLPSVMTLNADKKDGPVVGTAFLLTNSGIAATAWHVVNGANGRVSARFADGETFDVSGVVDKDEKRDLALVRVKVFGRPELSCAPRDPEVGSRVYVIGAPLGLEFSITEGLLSQIRQIDGVRQYQFSSPSSPGNSGGPLLDDRGNVLGVVSWQVKDGQNLNFAIPCNYLLALDKTLPTTPWDAVRSIPEVVSTSNLEVIDKFFANAFIALSDAASALRYQYIFQRRNGAFRAGVGPWFYSSQRELNPALEALKTISANDPWRNDFRQQLLNAGKRIEEAMDLAVQAVRMAQASSGWTGHANDLMARSAAAYPQKFLDSLKLEETPLWNSKVFVENLPVSIRQKNDVPDYLGVQVAMTRPKIILTVDHNSLASRLGVEPLDTLVSIEGKPAESVSELDRAILQLRGGQIKFLVSRLGRNVSLTGKIPADLAIAEIPKPDQSNEAGRDKDQSATAFAPKGTGVVYFYRRKSGWDTWFNPTVVCDGIDLARLEKNQYFMAALAEGEHRCWLVGSATLKEPVYLDVKMNTSLYVRYENVFSGRKLILVDHSEVVKDLKNLKPIEPDAIKNGIVSAQPIH